MPKIKNNRFTFKKRDKKSGEFKDVGYMDLKEDDEEKISLYFYGDIVSDTWSAWTYEDTCPQDIADFLNQIEKTSEINIYFNSGGGDVFGGLAIYNQLKRHEGHKTGHVDGMAASIASVIMFACDELHFSSGAQAMIHKPLSFGMGNADYFTKLIEQLDKCEDSILDIYMEHVKDGITRDTIKALVDNETWFSGSEIAEYFNVEIEEAAPIAACASDFYSKYKNLPEKIKDKHNALVAAVLDALDQREKENKEKKEKEEKKQMDDILSDLDMYGF